MLRVSLLICSPQGYSVKSNPDKKKEDVFPYKLTETIFASLYNFFCSCCCFKILSFSKDQVCFFSKNCLSPLQCVSTPPRISESHALRGWGGPWGQALQQMSINISPHCSQTFSLKWVWCCLTERVLKSLLWRHSGIVLMLKWPCCVENFLAAHSPTRAGITGWLPDLHLTEVCASLVSSLLQRWRERDAKEPKRTSIGDKHLAIRVCKWKRPLRDHTIMGVDLHEVSNKYKTHLAIKKNEKQVKFHLHVWVLLPRPVSPGRNEPLEPCVLENPQLTVS